MNNMAYIIHLMNNYWVDHKKAEQIISKLAKIGLKSSPVYDHATYLLSPAFNPWLTQMACGVLGA
jgi:hypothetical protein